MLQLLRTWLAHRKSAMEFKKLELARLKEAAAQERKKAEAQRRESERRSAALNRLAHSLQISLLQLPQCPDLKRQRSWVRNCSSLPIDFRRRQFARFQDLLLKECTRMIHSGVCREWMLDDLRAIVVGLGVAAFEADYIISAIPDRLKVEVDPNVEFQQRLVKNHTEHLQRLKVIEAIEHLSDDDRQQLIEEEHQRYRQLQFGYRDMDLSNGFGNDATTG